MESRDIAPESEDKTNKIREIVEREFQKEFLLKEQESLKIEDEILKTKKLLQTLRYAAISHYYRSGSSEAQTQAQQSIESNSIVSSGIQEFDQKPIHPSLKKLIGKKPINLDEIISNSRTRRKTVQTISTNTEKVIKVDTKITETITKPETQPNIAQLTSSRGKNQLKHRIVVGNTSQCIKQEPNSPMTHKWMCYVKTLPENSIEKLVEKVRFHLDSSFKPNDVIEVTSPPFNLTRRGFGEFPIKLLIFFKDEVEEKPVQIFHQLVLDKKLTGHQVLGGETVTELWTRNFLNEVHDEKKVAGHHLIDHDYFKTKGDNNSVP